MGHNHVPGLHWTTTTIPGPWSALLSSLLFSAAMLECRQRLPASASASARGGSAIVLRSERASERAHGAAVGVSGEGEGRARAAAAAAAAASRASRNRGRNLNSSRFLSTVEEKEKKALIID